jgi:hypothetical protein
MVASLNKGNRRIWTIDKFEVKHLISSANSRIEVRVAEFKRKTNLLRIEPDTPVEVTGSQLRRDS